MLNNPQEIKKVIENREITLRSGVMAKQANGAVEVRCGNTVLLAAATMSKSPKEGIDFFPLTVEYSEKMYASGKIPGGFFKREAKPSTNATLTSRLIDRPIRPCFPNDLYNEVQVIINVLSYDPSFSPDYLAIIGASAALSISDIPFNGPVGAARVGYINEQFIINPSTEEMEISRLDLIVAGTQDAILMVEAGALEVSEEVVSTAITKAHGFIKESIALQQDLIQKCAKPKAELPTQPDTNALETQIKAAIGNQIVENMQSGNKTQTNQFLDELEKNILTQFTNEEEDNGTLVKKTFSKIKKEQIRQTILKNKIRPDGRALDEVRPIEIEVGLLPNTHGSALFTRGETQSLGVVTLGTGDDQQIIDGLDETSKKGYYFHYNFPPFSVGETGRLGATSRRELGHGALAERALSGVLPDITKFPYTIRIVSEIFESNGSSSMASVCSGTLALMDCGVPIHAPVSGIAMGLLIENNDYTILSDIQGLEDHYGDMDFKVAGTEKGITALQLDIKVSGLSEDILKAALSQAKKGRLEILQKMNSTLNAPRSELSKQAPKIETIFVDPEKVGVIIGPGGKTIRAIEETSGAKVWIEDGSSGEVSISAKNTEGLEKAKKQILALVRDIEAGDEFDGKITRIVPFGAFVEIVNGKEGLMHISTFSKTRVNKVEDVLKLGQIVPVRVKEIDHLKRINLIPTKDLVEV